MTDWLARAMAAFAMAAQVRFVGAEDNLQWWLSFILGSTTNTPTDRSTASRAAERGATGEGSTSRPSSVAEG